MNVPEAIMILIGVFFTLLGYRVVGPGWKANVQFTPAQLKAEKLYRFAGPIICGLAMTILKVRGLVK